MTTLQETLDRMRSSRATIQKELSAVTEGQMTLQIPGRQVPADIRFLFYRLIAHEVEHTVHLIKTLHDLEIFASEAQLILQDLQQTRGKLEGLLVGISDDDLNREPANGGWALKQVIEHIVETEENYTARVVEALK